MVEENMANGGRLEQLSTEELERLSSRQQHLLKLHRQQTVSKEERLKALMSQFHRHEQKLDSLRHLRTSLQTQETRLHDLRQLKFQLDKQTTLKDQLSEELDRTRGLFAMREKELAEAVAKVDILTQQLERGRTMKLTALLPSNTSVADEIQRLKQEQGLRSQTLQSHKRKMEEKENGLLQRTLQRNELDQRIHQITQRLQLAEKIQQRDHKRTTVQTHQLISHKMPPPSSQTDERAKRVVTKGKSSTQIKETQPGNEGQQKENVGVSGQSQTKADKKKTRQDSSVSEDSAVWLTDHKSSPEVSGAEGNGWSKSSSKSTAPSPHSHSHLPSLVTDTLHNQNQPSSREQSPRSLSSATPEPSASLSLSDPTPLPPPPPAPLHQRSSPLSRPATGHLHHRRLSKDILEKPPPTLDEEMNEDVLTKVSHKRRVKFDPQALLLDASLEGELELVIKTCQQVVDVSYSNDEGITALHNAICAGHFQIVKFLVEFGCDVNAQDSDGWSPLHCAASCNNLQMCQLLVNHGACLFASTTSDQEQPADKCEQDEADYDACSAYLLATMAGLGRINAGIVYAVYSYTGQNGDELSFVVNEKLRIVRAGDDDETEWYWAEKPNTNPLQTGYVPRNLLALHPRVQRSLPS